MATVKGLIIRQGDVLLVPTSRVPPGCNEIPSVNGRIVLKLGELTGHAHAIDDWREATRIAGEALKLSARRARLLRAPNGERLLEVNDAVTLMHEEHAGLIIPPGIYKLPAQVVSFGTTAEFGSD